ncbi:unnamed protein product [Acanthoscelides obtectus]|uniref:Uncharacterized protein n=1 Tax=Acanthoscelides obtectus TaxID=200917 RepID=A0A9P0K403_ACAOB|nr:unnamed protein product [Acanthoscelides obtectus]CAK1629036.1 hypothetical protein AOBTE_LOCUS5545 [Acanthoscelides obtectus]
MYSVPQSPDTKAKLTTFRLPGGRHFVSPGFPPQTGSFQHLKELIKTERAKELQQQRAQEEAAARENQRNLARLYAHYGYVADSNPDDSGGDKSNEDKPPNRGGRPSTAALIGYPSFVPQPSNMARFGMAPENDYVYSRSGPRTAPGWTSYRPTVFDSPYNDVYGSGIQ